MTAPPRRKLQFTLWSLFVLTTIAAVLTAACTGTFGELVQAATRVGLRMAVMLIAYAVVAGIANIVVMLPILLILGEGKRLRRLVGRLRRRR